MHNAEIYTDIGLSDQRVISPEVHSELFIENNGGKVINK